MNICILRYTDLQQKAAYKKLVVKTFAESSLSLKLVGSTFPNVGTELGGLQKSTKQLPFFKVTL